MPERVDLHGRVLTPLDEDAVRGCLAALDAGGVESVAVGFLHAYANPAHEQRVAEILTRERPALWVSLSSEVCPEVRENESVALLIFWRKELRDGSGGAGRQRGGDGQVIEVGSSIDADFELLAAFDRIHHPARGRGGSRQWSPEFQPAQDLGGRLSQPRSRLSNNREIVFSKPFTGRLPQKVMEPTAKIAPPPGSAL